MAARLRACHREVDLAKKESCCSLPLPADGAAAVKSASSRWELVSSCLAFKASQAMLEPLLEVDRGRKIDPQVEATFAVEIDLTLLNFKPYKKSKLVHMNRLCRPLNAL